MKNNYDITIPEWTRLMVWIIGVLVLIGITVKDFLPLLADYENNNVATQVQVVVSDPEFNPPQIVVVLPHYVNENRENEDLMAIARHVRNETDSQCKICELLKNKSWDVWDTMNFTSYKNSDLALYNALSLAFVRKLLASLDSDQENVLDKKFSSWNRPVLSSVVNFFIWQESLDYDLKPIYLGPDLDLSEELKDLQSKMDQLQTETLKALCQQLYFTEGNFRDGSTNLQPTNKTCEDFLLNTSVPISFDDRGLWFPVPPIEFPAAKEYKFSILKSNSPYSLWIPSNKIQKPFIVLADVGDQYANTLDAIPSELYSTPFGRPITKDKSAYLITIKYSV